jgi:hypothetical protein
MWSSVYDRGEVRTMTRISLVGRGLHMLDLAAQASAGELKSTCPVDVRDEVRWSRTIGALGGRRHWRRLTRLRVAVVGCGRTGSVVARSVAHMGVRHLTLVDPDVVDTHCLGEAAGVITDFDLGQPKALAVANTLRASLPTSTVVDTVVNSIVDQAGLSAVKGCDVVFGCVDNDAARLSLALLAAVHARVLIDIGTSVILRRSHQHNRPAPREMGADVRLILPGDGCLLCRGGLTDLAGAITRLSGAALESRGTAGLRGRAGSLSSLNQIAAGVAVRLLEDLVTERIADSTWIQVEVDDAGSMIMRYPEPLRPSTRSGRCEGCARASLGDATF